jgi:hypothetical protein
MVSRMLLGLAKEALNSSSRRDAWVLAGAGVLCFMVALWLSAPGFMGADSGWQLSQARTGEYHDTHPVLMALIWRYTDRVLPGPLGILVLMTALRIGGLTLLAGCVRGSVVWRALGLVVVCFYPPLFSNVPAVWKDTLMEAGLISGVGCFAVFLRRPTPSTRRARAVDAAWVGAGLVLCGMGMGVRHNAPPAVAPLLALPLLALPAVRRLRQRWARLLVAGVGGTVLAGGIALGLGAALGPLTHKDDFWQVLPVFDLAGLSLETGELLVEPSSGVLTPGMGLEQIGQLYHPYYCLTLFYCLPWQGQRCVPLFQRTHDAQALAALRKNWERAILSHPLAYLKTRGRMAVALLGFEGAPPGAYYADGFPYTPLAEPYPPAPQTRRLMHWMDDHIKAFWIQPWPYALLCVLLTPISLWRYLKRRGSALAPALAASGLASTLGLMLAVGSPEYRYMGWTTLCSVLSLIATWGCSGERRLDIAAAHTSGGLSAPPVEISP